MFLECSVDTIPQISGQTTTDSAIWVLREIDLQSGTLQLSKLCYSASRECALVSH